MSSTPQGTRAYLVNIAWSWIGVVVVLLSSTLVTRFLILHLGKATFGIWALAASLIEYFWMIDLGFRPATVKLTAEYKALTRLDELKQVINTSLCYSIGAGFLVLCITWFGAGPASRAFRIDVPAFPFLIRIVGLSWSAGLAFNVFAA